MSHRDNQLCSLGVHNVTPTKPGTPRCQQKQDNRLLKSLQSKDNEYRSHSPKENMKERSMRSSPDG